MPFWGPIIGAGISAIGGLAGGMISSAGSAAANQQSWQQMQAQQAFSADQARRQMEFQERMSNTQYQRGMADMKAAGLNPILAYQQGGASAPTGAAGSAGGAQFENAMEGLGRGVSSASGAYRNFLDLQQVRANTVNTTTQAGLNAANTDLSKVNSLKAAQDTATSAAQERRAAAETALTIEQMDNPKAARALMGAQSHSAFQAGEVSRREAEDMSKYGSGRVGREILSPLDRVWERVKGVYGNAKPATQPGRGPDNSFPQLWNRWFGK